VVLATGGADPGGSGRGRGLRPAGDSLGAAGANPWWTGRIAMTVEGFWWLALLVQCLALPGTLLPLLPGLIWLPIGAALWRLWRACW
jgi:hypothetical protein